MLIANGKSIALFSMVLETECLFSHHSVSLWFSRVSCSLKLNRWAYSNAVKMEPHEEKHGAARTVSDFESSLGLKAIDFRMAHWLLNRDRNVAITDAILKEKASSFAKELNLDEFVASDNWINNFSER